MENYVIACLIKKLREENKMTQQQLADKLSLSEKTISKWETGRGLPDISILEDLASALNVSIMELFQGEQVVNKNRCANMLKSKFYVCPVCGNVISTIGETNISCCGVSLIAEGGEEVISEDKLTCEDGELYVHIDSPMTRENYVSFIAYVTSDCVAIRKLYPEQEACASFLKKGCGYIYYFDNRNGLFFFKISNFLYH